MALNFRKQVIKLQNMKEQFENEVSQRESIFDNRSEKWQESDKGQLYEEKTVELEEIVENLDEIADKIRDLFINHSS